jgi:Glycosyl hydrolases family 16
VKKYSPLTAAAVFGTAGLLLLPTPALADDREQDTPGAATSDGAADLGHRLDTLGGTDDRPRGGDLPDGAARETRDADERDADDRDDRDRRSYRDRDSRDDEDRYDRSRRGRFDDRHHRRGRDDGPGAEDAELRMSAVPGDGTATVTWVVDANGADVDGVLLGRDGVDTNGTGPWRTTSPERIGSMTFDLLQEDTTYTLFAAPMVDGDVGEPVKVQVTAEEGGTVTPVAPAEEPATVPDAGTPSPAPGSAPSTGVPPTTPSRPSTPTAPTVPSAPTVPTSPSRPSTPTTPTTPTTPRPGTPVTPPQTPTTPTPPSTGGTPPTTQPVTGERAPRGDVAGWRQVYVDDFDTAAASNQVGSLYPRLTVYPDGSGDGKYQAENVTVAGGALNIRLQNVGGQGQGAALTVSSPSSGWGQTYGRYSVRFRADRLPGFGSAMQLWPDSDVWADGETDFAEGDFGGGIHGYNHRVGSNPEQNSLVIDTGASWQDWHVTTIEWTPTAMHFYLDGRLVGTDTNAVARASRHWVIQAAEHGSGAATAGSGNLQVDWVAMYEYAG